MPTLETAQMQAMSGGLRHYLSAVPCAKHPAPLRYTKSRQCVQCAIDRANDSNAKNPGAALARVKKWKAANPERVKTQNQIEYARGKDRKKAQVASWSAANPERRKEIHAKWRKNNSETLAGWAHSRRSSGRLSSGLKARLMEAQNSKCACPCGQDLRVTGAHLDHIVAISRGGLNHDSNIQLLTPKCNRKKAARDNAEFMRQQLLDLCVE